MPKELLNKVNEAVAHETEDLSRSVAQILAEDPRQVIAKAKRAKYDPELETRVTSHLHREVTDIQQAFRYHQEQNTRWLHGLDHGRLDDSRLWKVFVGEPGYYKRREVAGEPNLAVGLLLDVSGSMGKHMTIVQQTAAVFSRGLAQTAGIDFAAWCSNGQGDKVALTRICDRQMPKPCLANIEQGGGTPSGTAIAGAKLLMSRMMKKRKLLVHFTDGKPDSAAHVLRAIRACCDAGIRVYAIGLPQHKEMLGTQYGEENYETIEAVSELPQAMVRILKKLSLPRR